MRTKDWIAFILLGTIWGSSFLWIKIAVQEIGPVLLVALRLLFGILGLFLVLVILRPAWPRKRADWFALILIGFTNNAIPYVLISWGEKYIDSAVAAILNSTTPLFTMLIAHFFVADDRMTLKRAIALIIGFIGVLLLLSRDLTFGSQEFASQPTAMIVWGQAAVLLAAILYAFSGVFARRTTQSISPEVRALIPLLGADLALWAAASLVEAPIQLPRLPLTWIAAIWLGLMGTTVAVILFFYLLHSVGPTRTTLVTYIFPIVGVALGVIFLKERLDWNLVAGGAMVVGSIVMVNR